MVFMDCTFPWSVFRFTLHAYMSFSGIRYVIQHLLQLPGVFYSTTITYCTSDLLTFVAL